MKIDNKQLRPIVAELWQGSRYPAIVNFVESMRPVVPTFQYKGESNIEEIKFMLAQQQMLDLVLSVLKP